MSIAEAAVRIALVLAAAFLVWDESPWWAFLFPMFAVAKFYK